jgi:hypothetical protein
MFLMIRKTDTVRVSNIIAGIRAAGAEIAINGDRLSVSHASRLPPGFLEEIRANKPALMTALQSPPAPAEGTPGGTDNPLPVTPAPGLDRECLAILEAAADRRPPDVTDDRWQEAIDGLRAFLTAGHGAEAERLGWPKDELYNVPKLWSQIHLCGAALLISDREVAAVTAEKIQIKTDSGSILTFYRQSQTGTTRAEPPEIDIPLLYDQRLEVLAPDAGGQEARYRAYDFVVAAVQRHRNCDLEIAKRMVLSVLKGRYP